jgi:hypothetical protein
MGTYATHGNLCDLCDPCAWYRTYPLSETSQADERIFRREGFRLQVGGRSATY